MTCPITHFAFPTLLSVVAPVYDEEELVEEFVDRALARSPTTSSSWCWSTRQLRPDAQLLDRIRRRSRVRVIHLSRNFGHQAALTAGLEHAAGDVVR